MVVVCWWDGGGVVQRTMLEYKGNLVPSCLGKMLRIMGDLEAKK